MGLVRANGFHLKVAERKRVKLRVGISAPSGGGKTYSALLLAYGMTGDWGKIAVIDTENESASLYDHLGKFLILPLGEPYTPERYIEAMKVCEDAGVEVIIVDSVSHEWEGAGGCLDIHAKMPGNSYTAWKEVTPRHKRFIDKILNSSCHVITTARRKTDYVIEQNEKGKAVPIKAGLKEIQREGFEYELTLNFGLEVPSHMARAEKDRTGLFMDQPPFLITAETGKALINWANSSDDSDMVYTETEEQKTKARTWIKQYGVDHNDIPKIKEAIKDKKMAEVEAIIKKFAPEIPL